MPTSSHHLACLTDDPGAVHTFLTEVIGLAVHRRFRVAGIDMVTSAGWPDNDGTDVVMYGQPPAGIVEVIAIPEPLRAVVRPRIWLASFATTDLAGRIAAARQHGFAPSDPVVTEGEVDLTMAMTEVGGITWELVTFGPRG